MVDLGRIGLLLCELHASSSVFKVTCFYLNFIRLVLFTLYVGTICLFFVGLNSYGEEKPGLFGLSCYELFLNVS